MNIALMSVSSGTHEIGIRRPSSINRYGSSGEAIVLAIWDLIGEGVGAGEPVASEHRCRPTRCRSASAHAARVRDLFAFIQLSARASGSSGIPRAD
jgi:hypothetical protein